MFGRFHLSTSLFISILAAPLLLQAASANYSIDQLRNIETPTETQERLSQEQELSTLRETLRQNAPKNIKNGLRFRLVELSFKSYQDLLLLVDRINHPRRPKAQGKAELAAPLEGEIEPMSVRPLLKEVIQNCEEILRTELPFEELPRVYFYLGFAYKELQDADLAFHYFSTLQHKFPKELKWVAKSNQAIAELKDHQQKYFEAIEYYEKVLPALKKEERAPVRARMSWSFFKAGNHKQAIRLMKEVIAVSGTSEREKAFRDLAQFMTEAGKIKEAQDYFSQVSGDPQFYLKMLKQLSVRARNKEAPKEEIAVYSALIQLDPKGESALQARIEWLELELKRKEYSKALTQLRGIHFPVENSILSQRVHASVLKAVSLHGQLFKVNQKRSELEVIEALHEGYLALAIREKLKSDIPETQMLLAETKRALRKNSEATELYRQVAESLDKRYAKQGALLWLSGLSEALRLLPSSDAKSLPTAQELTLVRCVDFISSHWEESLKKVPQFREGALLAAQIVAKDPTKTNEAIERAESVLEQWPTTLEGLAAAELGLSLLSDVPTLTSGLQRVRANAPLLEADRRLQRSRLAKFLKDQDQRLRLWDIVHSEQNQDYATAGFGYEKYGDESSKSEVFEKAYADAIRNFLKNTSTQPAILRVATHWIEKSPESPKAIEVLKAVAAEAMVRGNFELSASLYEQVGKDLRDPDSLETATQYFDGLLNTERLKFNWNQYVTLFGDQPKWGAATLELGKILETQNQDSAAIDLYLKCVRGSVVFQAECEARLGDLYLKLQDVTEAGLRYRRGSVLELSSPFTTYNRFQVGLLLEQSAVVATFDPESAGFQKQIEERQARLKLLETSYSFAAQGNGPWAVAALHRLALAYRQLALELDEIQEKFNRPLRDLSASLNQRAKALWAQAYAQGVTQESFSPVLGNVLEGLAQLGPRPSGRKHGAPTTLGPSRGSGQERKKAGFKLAGAELLSLESPSFFRLRERLLNEPTNSNLWVDFGNALWKFRKSVFAQIAYEKALSLNPQSASALNNLAIVLLGDSDRWDSVWKAAAMLRRAASSEDIEGQYNLATLMNEYYQFEKAKRLWDALSKRHASLPEVRAGAAWAEQGRHWVNGLLPRPETHKKNKRRHD